MEEVFEDFPIVICMVDDELCDIICTTEEVERYLKHLDVNKSRSLTAFHHAS